MENQDIEREIAWLLKEKYEGVESEAFHADCKRLATGEPLGYIIGNVPFLDCMIWLDSKPLIPRPETEYWTEKAIEVIKTRAKGSPSFLTEKEIFIKNPARVLDLCAGSGAIGVAVAKAITGVKITFAEIDKAHLPTIKKNLEVNTLQPNEYLWERFTIIQSDLFEKVEGQFDFILTNPPYIDMKAKTVDYSVLTNEPHLALFGGVAGMEIIERIMRQARASLAPAGQLWIEHEPFQADALAELAEANGFSIITHNDQYNIPRYSVLFVT